jgi:hypothetical protein
MRKSTVGIIVILLLLSLASLLLLLFPTHSSASTKSSSSSSPSSAPTSISGSIGIIPYTAYGPLYETSNAASYYNLFTSDSSLGSDWTSGSFGYAAPGIGTYWLNSDGLVVYAVSSMSFGYGVERTTPLTLGPGDFLSVHLNTFGYVENWGNPNDNTYVEFRLYNSNFEFDIEYQPGNIAYITYIYNGNYLGAHSVSVKGEDKWVAQFTTSGTAVWLNGQEVFSDSSWTFTSSQSVNVLYFVSGSDYSGVIETAEVGSKYLLVGTETTVLINNLPSGSIVNLAGNSWFVPPGSNNLFLSLNPQDFPIIGTAQVFYSSTQQAPLSKDSLSLWGGDIVNLKLQKGNVVPSYNILTSSADVEWNFQVNLQSTYDFVLCYVGNNWSLKSPGASWVGTIGTSQTWDFSISQQRSVDVISGYSPNVLYSSANPSLGSFYTHTFREGEVVSFQQLSNSFSYTIYSSPPSYSPDQSNVVQFGTGSPKLQSSTSMYPGSWDTSVFVTDGKDLQAGGYNTVLALVNPSPPSVQISQSGERAFANITQPPAGISRPTKTVTAVFQVNGSSIINNSSGQNSGLVGTSMATKNIAVSVQSSSSVLLETEKQTEYDMTLSSNVTSGYTLRVNFMIYGPNVSESASVSGAINPGTETTYSAMLDPSNGVLQSRSGMTVTQNSAFQSLIQYRGNGTVLLIQVLVTSWPYTSPNNLSSSTSSFFQFELGNTISSPVGDLRSANTGDSFDVSTLPLGQYKVAEFTMFQDGFYMIPSLNITNVEEISPSAIQLSGNQSKVSVSYVLSTTLSDRVDAELQSQVNLNNYSSFTTGVFEPNRAGRVTLYGNFVGKLSLHINSSVIYSIGTLLKPIDYDNPDFTDVGVTINASRSIIYGANNDIFKIQISSTNQYLELNNAQVSVTFPDGSIQNFPMFSIQANSTYEEDLNIPYVLTLENNSRYTVSIFVPMVNNRSFVVLQNVSLTSFLPSTSVSVVPSNVSNREFEVICDLTYGFQPLAGYVVHASYGGQSQDVETNASGEAVFVFNRGTSQEDLIVSLPGNVIVFKSLISPIEKQGLPPSERSNNSFLITFIFVIIGCICVALSIIYKRRALGIRKEVLEQSIVGPREEILYESTQNLLRRVICEIKIEYLVKGLFIFFLLQAVTCVHSL